MTIKHHDIDPEVASGRGSCYHHHYHHQDHHRQQHERPVEPPYENLQGAFVGDHYWLQRLRLQSDFLDIYAVTCLCGCAFEAQAFSLSCPCGSGSDGGDGSSTNTCCSSNGISCGGNGNSGGGSGGSSTSKLLDSRRRRMKRIYRSRNFVAAFEQAGKRFLVSEVHRTDAEWQNVCRRIKQGAGLTGDGRLATQEVKEREVKAAAAWCCGHYSSRDEAPRSSSSSLSSESNPKPLSYACIAAKGLEPPNT
ncbi:hypothetical protein DL766_005105 [Monosporascus sp. MC13-8B]|uniref:Uncharacterized protein n=1 Tax=Monosporascus cannonballus TaxID=155416 RepID=A0ABY0HC33_9PEZI|nr:hypothetical protein DL762_002944 [Monosporascus cannonballus]RYO97258.1 hypothetical protein DL763_002807 [Monosporascus cannonballus]RYP29959.1 hypothetical protein DL766_005105 [Monosporascus sp. MC13-8B]